MIAAPRMPVANLKTEEERNVISKSNGRGPSPDLDINNNMINEGERNLANQLNFISQTDAKDLKKDVEAYHPDVAECSTGITQKEEIESALARELEFLAQSKGLPQKQEAKEDNTKVEAMNVDIPENRVKVALSSELEFLAQSKGLPQKQEAEKDVSNLDAVDILKFISQPDSEKNEICFKEKTTKKVKNAQRTEASLLDEFNVLSKSPLVTRKQDAKVKINYSKTKKERKVVDAEDDISDTSSVCQATKIKHLSPIKHIIAAIAFSAIASLMTFAYLRIGLQVFCPYDEKLQTYVVIEKVEQCPVPIQIEDDEETCPFWKKCPEAVEVSVEYVPAPAGKRREVLCRGTFNVLHIVAALLHPNINYKKTMPQVHLYSPCPDIPVSSKKKKMNILQRLLSGKRSADSKTDLTESNKVGDGFDWTLYVSAPFDIDLTPEQRKIARKVTENLKISLSKKYPHDADQTDWFEQRLNKVQFGGTFPWWHPVKDKWGKDQEERGLRLVTAYLKIMDWPEVRRIKVHRCRHTMMEDFFILTFHFLHRRIYKQSILSQACALMIAPQILLLQILSSSEKSTSRGK